MAPNVCKSKSVHVHYSCIIYVWISGDSVRASPRLSGLWRIVAGHVRMGRILRMTWEGAITTRLSRGSVDRMRTLGWGSSGRYPVTGPCFLGNKNYESCLGAKCKKECHEAPWTKKCKVNDLYIYIVYNCNNIVEWNSPVISILILHTSKELKHWKNPIWRVDRILRSVVIWGFSSLL